MQALEDGAKASDADTLTLAGHALQEAGKVAQRQAADLVPVRETRETVAQLEAAWRLCWEIWAAWRRS